MNRYVTHQKIIVIINTTNTRFARRLHSTQNKVQLSRKKQDEYISFLNSSNNDVKEIAGDSGNKISSANSEQREQKLLQEQNYLFQEAKSLTKSLYRKCFRSVRLLSRGNTDDEKEFIQREKDRLDLINGNSFQYAPPVDRQNELSSRAMYYLAFLQESFHQEIDCLVLYPNSNKNDSNSQFWKEEQVKRFVYLMRQGEKRRQWILMSYKFDANDKIKQQDSELSERKLMGWELRADCFIKEVYQMKGWLTKSDYQNDIVHEEDINDKNNDLDEEWK